MKIKIYKKLSTRRTSCMDNFDKKTLILVLGFLSYPLVHQLISVSMIEIGNMASRLIKRTLDKRGTEVGPLLKGWALEITKYLNDHTEALSAVRAYYSSIALITPCLSDITVHFQESANYSGSARLNCYNFRPDRALCCQIFF